METGTIKSLTDRGFGFISIEGREKDLFFHSNELVAPLTFEQLKEGDKVQFEIGQSDKGENATKVSLVVAE
jgi:CspA family cold shock protein